MAARDEQREERERAPDRSAGRSRFDRQQMALEMVHADERQARGAARCPWRPTARPAASRPDPGPRVTAMPSTSSSADAGARERRVDHGEQVAHVLRATPAPGTTPPYGPCTASCDETTDESERAVAQDGGRRVVAGALDAEDDHVSSGWRLHREEDRVVAAPHEEEHALALPGLAHRLLIRVGVLHRLAVHLEDDVAAPEPGLVGRARRARPASRPRPSASASRPRFSASSGVSVCTVSPRSSLVPPPACADLLVLQLGDLDRRTFCAALSRMTFTVTRLADRRPRDQQRQLGRVVDRLAVELDDDVALLEARRLGRTVLHDVGDERALRVRRARATRRCRASPSGS